MNARHSLELALADEWPYDGWRGVGVLVAVSGGADSVALLRLLDAVCEEPAAELRVAHLNHGLRGAESDGDERFVIELCAQLGLECRVERVDVGRIAAQSGESIETAGRAARYAFLRRTAEALGARYVATAHTADDQVETVLHRIVRGTGLSGLAGMARARSLGPAATLLRPLLTFRRAELVDYLAALKQPYREDSSNADLEFTRNRIRATLLPLLREEFNADVFRAILRLASQATEARQLIRGWTEKLRQEAVRLDATGAWEIDCARLADEPAHLVRELFVRLWAERGWPQQAMGFDEWESLRAVAQARRDDRPEQRDFPGAIVVRREGNVLRLQSPTGV